MSHEGRRGGTIFRCVMSVSGLVLTVEMEYRRHVYRHVWARQVASDVDVEILYETQLDVCSLKCHQRETRATWVARTISTCPPIDSCPHRSC